MFRAGTELKPTPYAFVYNAGGIGDFINWTPSIQYAIETYPHLTGYVLTPPHFSDLAELWFRSYAPRYTVKTYTSMDFSEIDQMPAALPGKGQYANATGFSLFRLGWCYFNQINFVPEGWNRLPPVLGNEVDLGRFSLPESYVVVTTAATADNKRLKGEAIEYLLGHLRAFGPDAVLLGKKDVAPDHKGISPDFSAVGALDLRDQTTLTEAACIMARSRAVIGLDNGLLHLAACSSVPIAWAFTTADPRLIIPPRPKGARVLTLTPPESLECRFCQNRMKFLPGHDFRRCLYGDNLCTETYDGVTLISALRRLLSTDERNHL